MAPACLYQKHEDGHLILISEGELDGGSLVCCVHLHQKVIPPDNTVVVRKSGCGVCYKVTEIYPNYFGTLLVHMVSSSEDRLTNFLLLTLEEFIENYKMFHPSGPS